MSQLRVVNEQGEPVPGTLSVITRRAPCAFTGGFTMTNNAAMIEAARAPLGDQARRVLFALMGAMTYGNWVRVKQADLARSIGMQPSHFNRGLAKLIEHGIVLKNPDASDRLTHRLNPEYVWRGDGPAHRRALNEVQKARMQRAGITAVYSGTGAP